MCSYIWSEFDDFDLISAMFNDFVNIDIYWCHFRNSPIFHLNSQPGQAAFVVAAGGEQEHPWDPRSFHFSSSATMETLLWCCAVQRWDCNDTHGAPKFHVIAKFTDGGGDLKNSLDFNCDFKGFQGISVTCCLDHCRLAINEIPKQVALATHDEHHIPSCNSTYGKSPVFIGESMVNHQWMDHFLQLWTVQRFWGDCSAEHRVLRSPRGGKTWFNWNWAAFKPINMWDIMDIYIYIILIV